MHSIVRFRIDRESADVSDHLIDTPFPAPSILPGCFVISARPSSVNWYGIYYGLLPIFETSTSINDISSFFEADED